MKEEPKLKEKEKDIPELRQPKNFLGKISSLFVDRYKVVYLLIVSILLAGVYMYNIMPKEVVPDISMNQLVVYTIYPGASTSDVENLVTDEIEKLVEGLAEVEGVTSDTSTGVSQVIVTFDENADMDQAELDVNNAISDAKLPEGVMDPYVMVIEVGEIPIMTMTVTGDYDLVALKAFGETLQDHIEGIDGIREVELSGGYEREIQIIVDFNRLREYGISTDQLKNALQASNINLPAGEQTLDQEVMNIRVDEAFTSAEDIENLVLYSNQNQTVFLKDVAEVKDGYATPDEYSLVYIRDHSEEETATPAIYLSVFRESGYDIVGPCETINGYLDAAPGTDIPDDIEIIVTSDFSEDVNENLSTVMNNAIGGLLSVVIVLFIFIGLNESLIVSMVIPLSLFISMVVMEFVGITLNTISMTGFIIALGLLVDNAIVVMENVDRLREMGVDRVTASKAGANQVAPAVLAATLTTVAAFLPVAFTPGVSGQFLSILPKTVIFVILSSLVVSIVITPTLCSRFLSKYKKEDGHKSKKTSKKYRNGAAAFIFVLSIVAFANEGHIEVATIVAAVLFTSIYMVKVRLSDKQVASGSPSFMAKYSTFVYELLESKGKKALIMILAVAVLIGSVMTVPLGILKLELFPYEEPTGVKIKIDAPAGTPLDDTLAIAQQAEAALYDYEDIESFNLKVGDGNTNKAVISTVLVDENERMMSSSELLSSLRADMAVIPGATFSLEEESAMSKMSGGKPIKVGLKGSDPEQLNDVANAYLAELQGIEGVVDAGLSTEGGMKEVKIDIDKNRAAYYGLNVASISQEIRNQISGVDVGTYKEDGEEYDITLYYQEDRIKGLKDFDKMFFTAQDGSLVNFHDVATIETVEGYGTITHDDGDRIIYVEAGIEPGYNTQVVNKAFEDAVADIPLPSGVEIAVAGEMEEMETQFKNMMFSFMVALVLVYIILVVQFNSLIQPIVILLSVPFAIIGVVFGLILTGNNLGIYAMTGVVALAGIAVNDAIVLIDYINYLRGLGKDRRTAVKEAVETRFIPVLATSLTTIGGVLPLALYNDMFSQLGFALIFGLISSTVLTLLIIPIVYYALDRLSERVSEKLGLFQEEAIEETV